MRGLARGEQRALCAGSYLLRALLSGVWLARCIAQSGGCGEAWLFDAHVLWADGIDVLGGAALAVAGVERALAALGARSVLAA